jgi:hypothetical protein
MPKKKQVVTEQQVSSPFSTIEEMEEDIYVNLVDAAEEDAVLDSGEVINEEPETEEPVVLTAQDTYVAILAQSAPIENRFAEGRQKRVKALSADNLAVQERVRQMNHRDHQQRAATLGAAATTKPKQALPEGDVVHTAKGKTRKGAASEQQQEESNVQ